MEVDLPFYQKGTIPFEGAISVEDGDIVFFAASDWEQTCSILGVRLEQHSSL